jgi:hypothetical protein
MVKLFDAESHKPCGELTDDQFAALAELLEEEDAGDRDYYLHTDTLDALAEDGLDAAILDVLRAALAGREDMDLRWERA